MKYKKNYNRLFLLILFSIALHACQNKGSNVLKKDSEESVVGKSPNEIKLIMGKPLVEEPSEIVKGATIFEYPEQVKLQIENDKVVAVLTNPEIEKEKSIQYWFHELKDDEYEIVKTIDPKTNKPTKRSQLVCKKKGINIVFDEESGLVSRVIRYETSD